MKPGQISRRATILTLTFYVVAGMASAPDRASGQGHPKSDDTNSEHKYTPYTGWVACGGIPYEGYDGRLSQEGSALKRSDGAKVYSVTYTYTSARAAEAERKERLEEKGPKRKPWRIAWTEPLGDATIVEFAEPVSVSLKEDASNHWAIMWTRDRSLFLICGPDREHVIDYYQRRHSDEATKMSGTNIPGVVLNSLFKRLTAARSFKNMRALISATVLITILLPSPDRPKLLVANRLSVIIRCNPCCKGGGE
jgi:hypothetical protein